MKLQELVLFFWCRSLKLPKTQPVSWPKCWNCEPKIVSILITCAFWKFHLHSCAVYVILHDTSIYFWYLMFFGCIGPSLIAASHKQQTGNQISWCFSTLLGNISHQITALPHCHQWIPSCVSAYIVLWHWIDLWTWMDLWHSKASRRPAGRGPSSQPCQVCMLKRKVDKTKGKCFKIPKWSVWARLSFALAWFLQPYLRLLSKTLKSSLTKKLAGVGV